MTKNYFFQPSNPWSKFAHFLLSQSHKKRFQKSNNRKKTTVEIAKKGEFKFNIF